MAMLKVDRTQFVDAVEVLAGMTKRNRAAKAMLTFTNGVLSIKVGSTTVDVHSAGDWSGVAKTNGQAFLFASRDLPATGLRNTVHCVRFRVIFTWFRFPELPRKTAAQPDPLTKSALHCGEAESFTVKVRGHRHWVS